ncbi:wax ester/triacylglycerol synthase family O-acyltransferase [Lentzea sp. NEAU-D7]|uniref:wax ester/triacylglycerol synthase family O-acyltransferase n=1 Tax=Lentzea sp. NEAU-D7 TaxID=2994667 RepID=UPI00224A92D0|nr:wax ester/triacylglycerol synthase family O-acyltransferase [Lentzea sp. NEAU-D7]MCX2951450.1 wax ester/triacylglycerol synthase family O-acyltransferase [Lentzea sp. NEAU-D7]
MDHLSPLDAAFLDIEDADPHASLAIASVAVVEGPAPTHDEFLALMRARLPVLPRARQKLLRVPLDLGTPGWQDDPAFNLAYHVRRTALPAPGGDAELSALIARVMGQRLDRDRPLWEYWVVEGLAGGRWAIVAKVHHCLVDGVGGTMLYDVMYGDAPAPDPAPEQDASLLSLLGAAVTSPMRTARLVASAVSGLVSLVGSLLPVHASSLFGPLGTARHYRIVRASLAEVKQVAHTFGGTVNDVVLAAVSSAYRAVLLARGERPDPESVRTMVPVSVRGDRRMDNQVSVRLAFLPVEAEHVVDALSVVHQRFAALKKGNEAEAGHAVTELARHEPFAPLSWSIRLGAMLPQRSIVTVTTNVPGPREELRVLGRPIVEILPYVPIAVRIRTGIAVLSYADRLTIGITADYDSNPDVDVLAEALHEAFATLVSAAKARVTPSPPVAASKRRARTARPRTRAARPGAAPR